MDLSPVPAQLSPSRFFGAGDDLPIAMGIEEINAMLIRKFGEK